MSSTKAEITTLIEEEVMNLADNFTSTDYSNALDDAERETGWAFPVSDGFRTLWQKSRGKRYLYFYLATEATEEFKVRQLHLNQKFDHLWKTITYMDKEFEAIQESRPEEFSDVSSSHAFGTKIDAGFSYDEVGRDTTYDPDNLVIFQPTENQ